MSGKLLRGKAKTRGHCFSGNLLEGGRRYPHVSFESMSVAPLDSLVANASCKAPFCKVVRGPSQASLCYGFACWKTMRDSLFQLDRFLVKNQSQQRTQFYNSFAARLENEREKRRGEGHPMQVRSKNSFSELYRPLWELYNLD